MNAHDLPISRCEGCGTITDCGTTLERFNERVDLKPGDISVCLYCGHLSALGDDFKIRPLTEEEMYRVAGDPRILLVQELRAKAVKEIKKQ